MMIELSILIKNKIDKEYVKEEFDEVKDFIMKFYKTGIKNVEDFNDGKIILIKFSNNMFLKFYGCDNNKSFNKENSFIVIGNSEPFNKDSSMINKIKFIKNIVKIINSLDITKNNVFGLRFNIDSSENIISTIENNYESIKHKTNIVINKKLDDNIEKWKEMRSSVSTKFLMEFDTILSIFNTF